MVEIERAEDLVGEQPPTLRPTRKLWERCRKWGREEHCSAREVYARLLGGGEVLARIEKSGDGEVVWKRSNGEEVAIRVFNNDKDAGAHKSSG